MERRGSGGGTRVTAATELGGARAPGGVPGELRAIAEGIPARNSHREGRIHHYQEDTIRLRRFRWGGRHKTGPHHQEHGTHRVR